MHCNGECKTPSSFLEVDTGKQCHEQRPWLALCTSVPWSGMLWQRCEHCCTSALSSHCVRWVCASTVCTQVLLSFLCHRLCHRSHFSMRLAPAVLQPPRSQGRAAAGANVQKLHSMLMQLRKNCNHPDLITGEYDQSSTYPPADELCEQAGKLQLLERLLRRLRAGGHKVLIFSQVRDPGLGGCCSACCTPVATQCASSGRRALLIVAVIAFNVTLLHWLLCKLRAVATKCWPSGRRASCLLCGCCSRAAQAAACWCV